LVTLKTPVKSSFMVDEKWPEFIFLGESFFVFVLLVT